MTEETQGEVIPAEVPAAEEQVEAAPAEVAAPEVAAAGGDSTPSEVASEQAAD